MESQPSIPNITTKAIPKDPLRKTPSGHATPEDPLRSPSESATCSRSPTEKPFRSLPEARRKTSFETPFGPSFGARHVSRKYPKAPFGTSFGTTFGACHVSRKPHRETLRTYLRRVPRVPECSTERVFPGALRVSHVSRVPNRVSIPGSVSERATCPANVISPEASECAASLANDQSPEVSECDTCPEL